MVCTIKSHVSVQVTLEGDQVETLAFVSVVNFRIGIELRGIKLELNRRNNIHQVIMHAMEFCFHTHFYIICTSTQ